MTQTIEESYDDIPYEGQSFPQSHPDRLATLARLHGIDAPPITGARVLEIGCGPGGNLAPMGASLPGAQLVGIDLSTKHVELGRARLTAAGIGNVELRRADLADVGDSLGSFDYVIAHGLYSWVPPDVAERLLALIAQSLTPRGIAYVSYNTLPGWYGRSVLRDLMRFHATSDTTASARVKRGREMLAWLKDALPTGGRYAQPLVQEIGHLDKDSDWYLVHEFLCEDNRPSYVTDFVARAAAHGLRYFDDASPEITAAHAASPLAAKAREQANGDALRAEQYFDFLQGRTFRRALLCRAEVEVPRTMPHDAIEGLRVSSRLMPKVADADVKRRGPLTFTGERGELTSDHPLTKAALVHLSEVTPTSVPFTEVVAAARERLGDSKLSDRDVELLRRFVLRAFLTIGSDTLWLHSFQAPMVARAGERPAVTAWAREESKRHPRVTSMRHEGVLMDDTLRLLIPFLDGTRNADQLLVDWRRAKGRDFLPGSVPAALEVLARSGLLIA